MALLPPLVSAVGVMHLAPHLLPPVTPREDMRVSGSPYEAALEFRRSCGSGLCGMASNRGGLVSLLQVSEGVRTERNSDSNS